MVRGLENIKLNDLGFKSISRQFTASTRYDPTLQLRNKSTSDLRSLIRNIDSAMVRAILDISDNVERNLALAITSDIWSTNNGLGDIYLTGKLLSSGRVTADTAGININYDVPYASLIYYGGYITPYGNENASKVYIPPRPWIAAVMNGTNGLPAIDYKAIILSAISGVI